MAEINKSVNKKIIDTAGHMSSSPWGPKEYDTAKQLSTHKYTNIQEAELIKKKVMH